MTNERVVSGANTQNKAEHYVKGCKILGQAPVVVKIIDRLFEVIVGLSRTI